MKKKYKFEVFLEENQDKKIGKLKILDVKKIDKEFYFVCECDCGNILEIRTYNIISGATKSCGCLAKETLSQVGLKNRKHQKKCDFCGKEEHYALGYCKVCYNRLKRNNSIERKREGNYAKR